MTNGNKQERSPMVRFVLCAFLLLLLLANIWIRVSVRKVNIAAEGEAALQISGSVRYTLPAGSYVVEEPIGKSSGSSSAIPYMTWDRVCFNVKVRDRSGKQFYMAVRVQGKELKALQEGIAVELKGLGSRLDDEMAERQRNAVYEPSIPVYPVCLNDNNQPGL